MSVPNLYWPVYKNLEKEFIKLADYVHFSDDQLNIYSMHIADLIVRCAVEIEALSKELYNELGGNMIPVDDRNNPRDLYFDTDCLNLLEKKWFLSKKQITVSSINFYFADEKNKVLTPLHKANRRGSSGSKWKQAYQAIKHDRRNSLKKATVGNLLNAMGALYILNLYYKNERIDIGRVYLSDHNFDCRSGSEIFSAFCYKATFLSMNKHMDDSNILPSSDSELEKSIFIIKYDDMSFKKMHKNYCLDAQITEQNFNKSTEIANFLRTHPEYADKNINDICLAAGGQSLLVRIKSFKHTTQEKGLRMEAILNKHIQIYPELLPLDSEKPSFLK